MTARELGVVALSWALCVVLALALGLLTPRTAHAPVRPAQEVTR